MIQSPNSTKVECSFSAHYPAWSWLLNCLWCSTGCADTNRWHLRQHHGMIPWDIQYPPRQHSHHHQDVPKPLNLLFSMLLSLVDHPNWFTGPHISTNSGFALLPGERVFQYPLPNYQNGYVWWVLGGSWVLWYGQIVKLTFCSRRKAAAREAQVSLLELPFFEDGRVHACLPHKPTCQVSWYASWCRLDLRFLPRPLHHSKKTFAESCAQIRTSLPSISTFLHQGSARRPSKWAQGCRYCLILHNTKHAR